MQRLAKGRSVRRIHFHDPDAPAATVVAPCVFVAVRNDRRELLLVRRCDSGTWELPGGRVDIGELSVVIAVSAPHREDALAACKEAIDTLKQTVPLWKKEVYEGGEEWIGRGS